jgi:hypothetical protein
MYIKKVKKPKVIEPQTKKQITAAKVKIKKTKRIVKHLKKLDRGLLIAFLTEWGNDRLTGDQCLTMLYDDEANTKLDAGKSANEAMVPHGIKKTKMDELKKKSDKRMKR